MVIMLKQNHKQAKKTFSRRSRGFLRQMFNMRFNSKKFVTKDFEKHFAEEKVLLCGDHNVDDDQTGC